MGILVVHNSRFHDWEIYIYAGDGFNDEPKARKTCPHYHFKFPPIKLVAASGIIRFVFSGRD